MKLPDGYRLPEGTTMAAVRRLDQELLASEGPGETAPERLGLEDLSPGCIPVTSPRQSR